MHLSIQPFTLQPLQPHSTSNGIPSGPQTNLWLRLEQDGIEGWGEAAPCSTAVGVAQAETEQLEELNAIARRLIAELVPFSAWDRQTITTFLEAHHVPSALRAAIDMALWDWLGKAINLPLWQLWGLNTRQIVPNSVTIQHLPPLQAQRCLQHWVQAANANQFKVQLGSSEGIAADQRLFSALQQVAPPQARFSVDALGRWSLAEAVTMTAWLATYSVDYVEQPLAAEQSNLLAILKQQSSLPIFVAESCATSRELLAIAPNIAGIDIKLMKCGGLTEALKLIHIAQTYGLQVSLSCYSNSTLANTAAAHLAPLADYLHLDSHLAFKDALFKGLTLNLDGVLQIPKAPGLGVTQHTQTQTQFQPQSQSHSHSSEEAAASRNW